MEKGDPRAEDKIETIRTLAHGVFLFGKERSVELRRSAARDGLEVTLADLLPVMVPDGVRSHVSLQGDEAAVPAYAKDELHLVLREAVRNAVKHSGARRITVRVSIGGSRVVAAVSDDGRGFEPAQLDPTETTGLRSMRERVQMLSGDCHISSAPGRGTTIELDIPLPPTS